MRLLLVRPPFLFTCLLAMVMTAFHAGAATCQGDVSDAVAAGNLPNSVTLDKGTTAQPLGGTLVFTVPTPALSKEGTQLTACFRWRPRDADAAAALKTLGQNDWSANVPLRVVDSKTDMTTLSVEVPSTIASVPSDTWISKKYYEYAGVWPKADFRVLVAGASGAAVLDEIIPISITSYWISAGIAVLGTLAFWTLVYGFSRWNRDIRGGFFLGVICNQNGYASLSQFQIMMWTVVIGAASIYVVVLTGRLLNIPTPTLALLGIAGATTVAAAVPKTGSGGAAGGGGPTPGKVTRLRTVGQSGANSVVLAWAPPNGGEVPTSYAVKYRTPPGAGGWPTAGGGGAVPETVFEVAGLTANTPYEFQVTALNANGPGPDEQTIPITTAAGGAAAVRPLQVQAPTSAGGAAAEDHIAIQWPALATAPDAYVVSFRRVGALVWTVADVTPQGVTNVTISELSPGTDYQFQVRAVAGGQAGPASTILSARTKSRIPEYMDLLVWDGTREIDVTRLQMLFFTLVAALFVSVKVAAENEIPSISEGLLLLIGVSNGVYVTSKYVTGRR